MLVPVILSGGAGTRLWPVSRELHPKPFMRLADGQSLLQKAFLRAAGLPGVEQVLTVTNRELYFKTEDEYREVDAAVSTSFILEPFGRNTAPAIAAAALHVMAAHGADALLLVLAADHLITRLDAFADAVSRAEELARAGHLVTFGIQPLSPETGYGYIEAEGSRVLRFVEKPSRETAEGYVASGRYLWNSGMFCFSAATVLEEFERHAPDILAAVRDCLALSRRSEGEAFSQVELDGETFRKVPDISVDYALFEKSERVAVVGCDIGWSDVGSWNAVSDLAEADEFGNRVEGEALLYDSANCYVRSAERIVGAVGVRDLLIIDTPDALLVADKSRAQDVKQVVAQLKVDGHDAYKLHRTVHRPWGTYTVLEEGARFKIKRIEVNPGATLSLQMHYHRSEHWVVVSGMAKVANGDAVLFVNTNESTFIPAGHAHRLENPGKVPLVMIEVQSGEYLAEDDIVRLEDRYGRE